MLPLTGDAFKKQFEMPLKSRCRERHGQCDYDVLNRAGFAGGRFVKLRGDGWCFLLGVIMAPASAGGVFTIGSGRRL